MGYEDRQYFRDDSPYGRTGLAQYSIIAILIAINVIVWVLDTFTPEVARGGSGADGEFVVHWLSGQLCLDPQQPWRVWTLLTHGFTHASIETNALHILFNMFVLFMFGRPVSERLGRHEFLRFYLSAIVVSGFVFFLYSIATGSANPAVGASGATTAVLILFILWYPDQKLSLMGVIDMPAWGLGLVIIAMDLFRAVTGESGIAWQAHLGGAAFAWAYLHFEWDFRWMSSLSRWLPKLPKGNGKLSVYNPAAKPEKTEKLRTEGDRILAKISTDGEDSLTKNERKTLERYSKMLRDGK